MKKVIVISLGGSLIVPEKMNVPFLLEFVKTLRRNYKKYKFVIVCGGGTIARKYISTLEAEKKSKKELAQAGIMATRMNAQFVMKLFGKEANDALPTNMKDVKDGLAKNKVVICGALRYAKKSTTDGTAAKLSYYLKTDFINMTNVKGLYDKNPFEHKDAKFISYESWKNFEKRALRLKFKAAQHFVLDQNAATMIRKNKIRTYIIGPNLRNLEEVLRGRKFEGTVIEN